jgi:hypothetical protein
MGRDARADPTPAFRGPSRSTQAPNTAADDPRKTKNSVYIQPRVLTRQSPAAGDVNANRAAERQPEHTEGVGHAN